MNGPELAEGAEVGIGILQAVAEPIEAAGENRDK